LLAKPDRSPLEIVDTYTKSNAHRHVLFVTGLENYLLEDNRLEQFNFSREAWFRFDILFIFWFPAGFTLTFRKRADDFFNWVQVTFDFSIPPELPGVNVTGNKTAEPGKTAVHFKTKDFQQHVADIFRFLGYHVEVNRAIAGNAIDIVASKTLLPLSKTIYLLIECKDYENKIGTETIHHYTGVITACQNSFLHDAIGVIVSGNGFTTNALETAKQNGIECLTVSKLRQAIVDLSL